MLIVICAGEGLEAVGIELAARGVQLLPVVLGQLRPERVDGDDEGAAVGLELQGKSSVVRSVDISSSLSYREYLAHDLLGLAADLLAELVEGLQVGLVQRVADDLNVHLVEVLLVDAALEEGGLRENNKRKSQREVESLSVLTERRVNEDGVVELGRRRGDVDGLHLFEAAQRVALAHQLGQRSLVQGASDQQDDVVNHVAVPIGQNEELMTHHSCTY